MATLQSIDAPVWGISTVGYGVIAQGLASIRQCIDIILRTRKKTDPLRPEFGSDIWDHIDKPLLIAIPNIKKAIIEAIEIWEKRIQIISVRHYLKSVSNPVFEITFRLVDEDLIDSILFGIDGTEGDSRQDVELILQAFFPPNPNGYRYQINFERNASPALPEPPTSGFASIQELFAWINENWFFYGRWFILSDRIVLYMKSAGVTSASLSISVLPLIQVEAVFPTLASGEFYSVEFIVNGVAAVPPIPATFQTPSEVLVWVRANWGSYAAWSISSVPGSGTPVFGDDFSDEFDTEGGEYQYKLIAVSNKEGFEAELNITSV